MKLQEIREKYPKYNSLSDKELADRIHKKHRPNMPIEEFYAEIGFNPNGDIVTNEMEFLEENPGIPQGKKYGSFDSFLTALNRYPQKGAENILSAIGLPGVENVAQRRDQELEDRRLHNPTATSLGDISGQILRDLPGYAVGSMAAAPIRAAVPGVAGKIAEGAVAGGIGGGLAGGMFGSPGNRIEDAKNEALLASIVGGVLPAGVSLAGAAVNPLKKLLKPQTSVASNIVKNIPDSLLDKTIETGEKAQKYGLNITPSEASGFPVQGGYEGKLGLTRDNAVLLNERRLSEKENQKGLIDSLLDAISPEKGSFSRKARQVAADKIQQQEKRIANEARPYYESSKYEKIDPSLTRKWLKDPVWQKTEKQALKDKAWAKRIDDLKNQAPKIKDANGKEVPLYKNTVGYWDILKQVLNDDIEAATRAGEKGKASVFKDSKNQLLNTLDEISPNYKKGREIYIDESPAVDLLRKGDVGKISKLNDDQLQYLSKKIFDPNETDIEAFNRIRDALYKQDPKVWNGVVRNEMERLLENASIDKTGNFGSVFYDQILSKERIFREFDSALSNNPAAQQTLRDLREIFKNLNNAYTSKTARGFSETGVSMPRNTLDAFKKAYAWISGGQGDKAAIELITTPKWIDEFKKIRNSKISANEKDLKTVDLLKKIAKDSGRQAPVAAAAEQGRTQ